MIFAWEYEKMLKKKRNNIYNDKNTRICHWHTKMIYAAGAAKPETQPRGWALSLLDQLPPVALSTLWMISAAEAFSRQ